MTMSETIFLKKYWSVVKWLCGAFSQTEEEIAELEEEIRRIQDAIRGKINPMKLAQTRLENRTYRPNVELCRDNVQYGLTDEVRQIDVTKRSLEEKLKQARLVQQSFFLFQLMTYYDPCWDQRSSLLCYKLICNVVPGIRSFSVC